MNDQSNFFDEQHQHGSFVAGMSVGLILGAAGYFLFATRRGAALRKELVREWESSKEQMLQEGVLDAPQISLRQFLQRLSDEVFHFSLPINKSSAASPTQKSRKNSPKATPSRPRRSHTFRGV